MSMTLIATATVGGTPATITFSSIPQTYTDLFILFSVRSTHSATVAVQMLLNGNSGTQRRLEGIGSSVASYSDAAMYVGVVGGTNYTSNTFGNGSVYLPNYTSTAAKSYSADSTSENNATATALEISAGISTSTTSAISSIFIGDGTSGLGWATGSTISLYGITKGSGGATVS